MIRHTYTSMDEVHPPRRGMYYGMPFGYTLLDEVHPPRRGMHYGMPLGGPATHAPPQQHISSVRVCA